MFVQMEEEMCDIREFPSMTKLSPVVVNNGHGDGFGVSLSCYLCREYGTWNKKS